ncbi:amphi-Trp domain-containing protein [Haliea sp. E17]|uniref:amphi-Trp domain-containing protein n=1 Tax=Haliea sp. E17 TaxID=3401576 RepID=UPI003AAFB13F
MELLEITDKLTLSREAAADQLRAIADALSRHNGLEYLYEGKKLHVRVPDEVRLEIEVEVKKKKGSIEIELKWKQ